MTQTACESKLAFILDPSRRELRLQDGDYLYLILKVACNDSIDFLYSCYQYKAETPMRIGEKLEYTGFVHHPSGRLFDCAYRIFRHGEDMDSISLDVLKKEAQDAINMAAIARINDKPVPVTDHAEEIRDEREYYEQHEANSEARRAFFEGETRIPYKLHATIDPNTEDIMQMVMDMDGFVQARVDDYIIRKANHINERLWQISIAQQRLDQLRATPGIHHTTLAIADSVTEDMKMVNLVIDKEGKQMTIKYPASVLRYADHSDYSTYQMDAPGRRKFEDAYGRQGRLYPNEIKAIIYGKKTLYEREEMQ